MTRNERIDAERAIQKYNDKKWTGSVGAVLLHRAASVIKHYKDENKELTSELREYCFWLDPTMCQCADSLQCQKYKTK